MKSISIIVVALLLASCASQKVNPYSDLSANDLDVLFGQAKKEKPLRYCEKLLPLAKERSRRDASSLKKKAYEDYADFQCALDERRWDDAYTAMVRYESNSWKPMGSFGFRMAYYTGHYQDAVERLEALGPNNYSRDIFEIDPQMFWGLFSKLSSSEENPLQKRAIDAMVQSPYFTDLDAGFRSGLSAWKLRFDAKSGSFQNAEKWISAMVSPTVYLAMLADRRFEAIWPDLEQAVGEHFVDINDRNVNVAKERYQRDASDMEAYQNMAHALLFAGKFQEVIDFVATPENGDFPTITENEAWALNMKVEALDALGREEEGTALFDSIASIQVNDNNRYWLINFTINRAARLAGYGRWKQALEAAEYAEGFQGSAYAKMIIRHVKACAHVNQGNSASDLLNELYENRKDSYVDAARAMVCGDEEDRAVEVLLDALEDEEEAGRSAVIEALQDRQFSFYTLRPEGSDLHHLLGTNSRLRRAFEKEARLIPEKYVPLARIKQQQNKK